MLPFWMFVIENKKSVMKTVPMITCDRNEGSEYSTGKLLQQHWADSGGCTSLKVLVSRHLPEDICSLRGAV